MRSLRWLIIIIGKLLASIYVIVARLGRLVHSKQRESRLATSSPNQQHNCYLPFIALLFILLRRLVHLLASQCSSLLWPSNWCRWVVETLTMRSQNCQILLRLSFYCRFKFIVPQSGQNNELAAFTSSDAAAVHLFAESHTSRVVSEFPFLTFQQWKVEQTNKVNTNWHFKSYAHLHTNRMNSN